MKEKEKVKQALSLIKFVVIIMGFFLVLVFGDPTPEEEDC